ncbi:uncharacterized protein LOC142495989 isoform X2 [Ascaphus truei]|uniref:uncharacterized protein LOC142495989 isoform X2 n=1 Tax=Ascaphus truei TaxID=8439 RepID=UPI003F5A1B53
MCEENIAENKCDDKKRSWERKISHVPASTPHKLENIVNIIVLDNSVMSQRQRNELQHDPDDQVNDSGEFTAEVKCDHVHFNLELKKGSASNSRTHILITNNKILKKSRSYHDTQHQQCQHPVSHIWDFVGDGSGKHKDNSTTEKLNSEMPMIKIEIIGEGIEVNYKTINQNLMVHIEVDEARKECEDICGSCNTHNTEYPSTEGSCSSYPVSDFSLQERKELYANDICPEQYVSIPPPEEFADGKEALANTIIEDEALFLEDTAKESYFIPSISSCWSELETEQRQVKADSYTAKKTDELDDRLYLPYLSNWKQCSHELIMPNKAILNKVSYISNEHELKSNPCDYYDWRKNNYPFSSKVVRRKTFPQMYVDSLRTFNHIRDSVFDTESQPLTFKALPDYSSASKFSTEDKEKCLPTNEFSRSLRSVSYLECVSNTKEPLKYTSMASGNEMTVSHSEAEDIIDDFFLTNCSDFHRSYEEKKDADIFSVFSLDKLDVNEKPLDKEDLMKHSEEHIEFVESGFDEEMPDSDNHTDVHDYSQLHNTCLLIQVIPPSRSSSREYILEKSNSSSIPTKHFQHSESQIREAGHSSTTELEITRKRRGSVVTVVTGDQEQRLIIQGESRAVSESTACKAPRDLQEDSKLSCIIHRDSLLTPVSDVDEPDLENKLYSSFEDQISFTLKDNSSQMSEMFDSFLSMENKCNVSGDTCIKDIKEDICLQLEDANDTFSTFHVDDKSARNSSDSAIPGTSLESVACQISCFVKSDSEENYPKNADEKEGPFQKAETPKKKTSKKEMLNKHLKLPKDSMLKESKGCDSAQEEASDRLAKKRKQFKETKICYSAGGSSVTSNITEESGNSEETRSVDLGVRTENKDKGLYTESFHSASWIFRGDDCSPDNSPRCLSKRPKSVAIRERTVRIAKGTGDYPWGFRIQFSKPILVTEVDTNGAAEEAGLQVGDIVMAVNGTDVTSIPHSEAASLARQGPDLLTLVVGSDISRFPNTPRPTCRGYLHKRTHSGLLKGWRKRWFVLKHDGSLYYYKHKKDEGKCRPLDVTKLEGSEVGVDTSLGKPFVFRCVPQSANRIFYFCATSNQEMKRWLEAMDKAVHPLNQNHMWVDVTMHNISLPPLAIKNPECLGLLHQLDRTKDVWVQHYCILKDGCLYFYSSIRSTNALGGIYLQGYTVSEQSLNSKRCIIELRPPSEECKTFYLSAGNATENKRWITALKISISKWLPLHQAIQDFMSRPLEETRM